MNTEYSNRCKKALVITTVASTIDQFCMNDISILQKEYEVHVASNFGLGNNTPVERIQEFKVELASKNIKTHNLNFNRNPYNIDNYYAYKEIKEIIENNDFDIIHCHTPIAAMVVRVAARKARKNGTKVIYTAHGFHFYKGAPLINWLIYYPIERLLSKYTDILITINKEDYNRAKNSLKAGMVEYIPGVGIDTKKINAVITDKAEKRRDLGIPEGAFLLLSVGELNKNKNHEAVIRAMEKLNDQKLYYIICGQGILEEYLEDLIQRLDLQDNVKLLGYRRDIHEINKSADLFILPSIREGLPVALMEAMVGALPVICSMIRGNTDLIDEGKGGHLVDSQDVDGYKNSLNILINDQEKIYEFGIYNKNKIRMFDLEEVGKKMKRIYS